MLHIAPDVLRQELKQIRLLLKKWAIELEKGIPGEEAPSSMGELELEIYEARLKGELSLAASRLVALIESLDGE